MPPHYRVFRITLQRHQHAVGLLCCIDPYLTTHNTNKIQTFMPLAGFKPEILSSKQPQTHDLDRTATAVG